MASLVAYGVGMSLKTIFLVTVAASLVAHQAWAQSTPMTKAAVNDIARSIGDYRRSTDATLAQSKEPREHSTEYVVSLLAGIIGPVTKKLAADNANYARDFLAIHFLEVIEPDFRRGDPNGLETARRASLARAVIGRQWETINARQNEVLAGILAAGLTPSEKAKARYNYAAGLAENQPSVDRQREIELETVSIFERMAKIIDGNEWTFIDHYVFEDPAAQRSFVAEASRLVSLEAEGVEIRRLRHARQDAKLQAVQALVR